MIFKKNKNHNFTLIFALFIFVFNFAHSKNIEIDLKGELKKWHTITLDLEGPQTSEGATDNPFLNYKLDVVFSNGNQSFTVPGYYAADGNAAETGAVEGNIWRVHFTPNKTGKWEYQISFTKGPNIAVSDSKGTPLKLDGVTGKFTVEKSDKGPNDFRKKGRLLVQKDNYLQFSDSKDYFLKAGAGSPENFLAYSDFDNTYSLKKETRKGEAHSVKVKTYENHLKDWKSGDPTWKNGKGKSIIGALNYLAEEGVNSVYFLVMNVYGDGQDIWPWINEHEMTRYDCSKMDQWKIVFQHMQNKGILAHVFTQETENELLLDLGNTGTMRKLFYRELVARFSNQLAIIWNLGEENGYANWAPNGQNTKQRKAMSANLKEIDPYNNPVVLHTHADKKWRDPILNELLDDKNLDGPSFQIHHPNEVHEVTLHWKKLSKEKGLTWIFPLDEIGPANKGAMPDANDPDHDEIRSKVLWGNLMAGGSGVEWYFGYKYAHNDLKCEDWRSRDLLWDQTVAAVQFFQSHLPFSEMESIDDLTTSPNDYVFAKQNEVYCIYLPKYEASEIDLSDAKGSFDVKWFNPKSGGDLINGSVSTVEGGNKVKLGIPLAQQNLDWVVLLKKKS